MSDTSTPVIHYGNITGNTGTAVLFKLQSGITIAVLWEGKVEPPRQDWWNDNAPEWTTIEEVLTWEPSKV